MEDFDRALGEIFGDTEWEVLERNFNRHYYSPDDFKDGIPPQSLLPPRKRRLPQKYQNDK